MQREEGEGTKPRARIIKNNCYREEGKKEYCERGSKGGELRLGGREGGGERQGVEEENKKRERNREKGGRNNTSIEKEGTRRGWRGRVTFMMLKRKTKK